MSAKIFTLIPKIMSEVGHISKSRTNTQGSGYKFRGIDDVYNALQGPLSKNGVFFTPNVIESNREERQSKAGGHLIYTVLRVKFTFYADDGSSFEVTTMGEAMDSGDKSANKAMSAALKYALLQVFCISTEEDNDTETQTHEITPKKTAAVSPIVKPTVAAKPNGLGAFCTLCESELVVSKSGAGFYCLNFKDVSNGEHTRGNMKDLAAFKASQVKTSAPVEDDVPMFDEPGVSR